MNPRAYSLLLLFAMAVFVVAVVWLGNVHERVLP